MLIVYGIILYFIEDKLKARKITSLKDISYKMAFAVGVFQCLAMIPGTSRSGATIIGALLLGLSKGVAAEFSFFSSNSNNVWSNTFKTYEKWA